MTFGLTPVSRARLAFSWKMTASMRISRVRAVAGSFTPPSTCALRPSMMAVPPVVSAVSMRKKSLVSRKVRLFCASTASKASMKYVLEMGTLIEKARPSGSITCLPVTRENVGLMSVRKSAKLVSGRNETSWSGGITPRTGWTGGRT